MMTKKTLGILLLQETHLDQAAALRLATLYPGLGFEAHCSADGSAGVMTVIRKDLVSWAGSQRRYSDNDGRLLVCSVCVGGQEIIVGNLYAPANELRRREWFQHEMEQADDMRRDWGLDVVGGDWNFVEDSLDRETPRFVSVADTLLVNSFRLAWAPTGEELIDGWRSRYPDVRLYTHLNNAHRANLSGGMTRIDRLYVRGDWLDSVTQWSITKAHVSTDHNAVGLQLRLATGGIPRGPGRFRIPMTLIVDPLHVTCALDIITGREEETRGSMSDWFDVKKPALIEYFKELVKTSKSKRGSRAVTLGKLMDKYASEGNTERFLSAQVELLELEQVDASDYCYNALSKYRLEGESPSKQFYDRVKGSAKRLATTPPLQKLDGQMTEGKEQQLDVVHQYYTRLFEAKPTEPEVADQFLIHCDEMGTEITKKLLEPIDVSEVILVVTQLHNGKSPGLDGIPCELYKALLEVDGKKRDRAPRFATYFTQVLNDIFAKDTLPKSFVEGVLVLLFKKNGDPSLLKDYRPLSIMGVDYKIYTSILSIRLVSILASYIGPQQSAFLPGRLIGDNIRTVQAVIDAFESSEEPASCVFLDQEKAYDRVDHTYLASVMRKMGIPERFVKVIQALYHGAATRPVVNGWTGQPFLVKSGVRQGDPLSCILYDIAIEPFARYLINSEFQGVKLPDGTRLKLVQFADDTTPFPGCNNDFYVLSRALGLFERATAARLNYQKSWVIHLGRNPLTDAEGLYQVVPHGSAIIHLGVPVGVQIGVKIDEFWVAKLKGLQTAIGIWQKSYLSMRARVQICKSLLEGTVRYFLQFLDLSSDQKERLQAMQSHFIWNEGSSKVDRVEWCLPTDKGGLEVTDIDCLIKAYSLETVARMDAHPERPWVQLQRTLITAACRTAHLHLNKAVHPWKQVLNSKRPSPRRNSLYPVLRDWYAATTGRSGFKFDAEGFTLRSPRGPGEVLAVHFWYFPGIFNDGPLRQTGVRLFHSAAWKWLASAYPPVNTIGDLWDVETQEPKCFPEAGPALMAQLRTAIQTFMSGIPPPWRAAIASCSDNDVRNVGVFQHAGVVSTTTNTPTTGDSLPNWRDIQDINYRKAYDILLAQKVKGKDMFANVGHVVDYVNRVRPSKPIRPQDLFTACVSKWRLPKQNDLLWRLLVKAVRTGDALGRIPGAEVSCPIDGHENSIEHLFIECSSAREVWAHFREVINWAAGGSGVTNTPTDLSSLLGLFAIAPISQSTYGKSRYEVLFATAMWAIWKSYLGYQFEGEGYAPLGVSSLFGEMAKNLILGHKVRAIGPKHHAGAWNRNAFIGMWGSAPKDFGRNGLPRCLQDRQE
jgi:exonuclease III